MDWKKMCPVGVVGLYFVCIWSFVVVDSEVAALNFYLWLLVILGCFTCLFAVHTFIRRIRGKTWFTLSTLLLSILIGGYYLTYGIMTQPSMGMAAAPFGVVLFTAIWVLYAVISWFVIPLGYKVGGKDKSKTLKRTEETKRKVCLLNIWQRRVICVGLFVIGLICIYAPVWYTYYDYYPTEQKAKSRGFTPLGGFGSVRYTALIVETASAIVITGIVVYLVRDRTAKALKASEDNK